MKFISIIVGKLLIVAGNILHRGSTLPGKIALKIDKDLLRKIKYPSIRIAVTGSSGKGSTSKIIASVLQESGYSICYNKEGSNLSRGIATTLLRNSNIFGKIKKDVLVIEIDERYTKDVFKYMKPTHIVVTNITKDQPPRQHHVDIVYNDILDSIQNGSKVITNMDDPYLRNLEKDKKGEYIYYSIDKNKYSYKNQIFENLNIYYCPYCKNLLEYDYYNFETLGKYKCSKCDFKYEETDVTGKNLDLEKGILTINNFELNIGGDMLYNAYNTLAAYTTLKTLDLDEKNIVEIINKNNQYKSNSFIKKEKTYYPMSCKAENSTTYNQSIFKVIGNKEKKDIIIGWKEISRRYKYFDISWLYDIEFELLNNKTLNKVYACGIDKENIKKRLLLAGITENKIITADNIEEIKEDVLNSEAMYIYGILNFDYVEEFNKAFREDI